MCQKATDLDAFVRVRVLYYSYTIHNQSDRVQLSNEFQFPIAAFHHASEAYLVPDLLKQSFSKSISFTSQ